jgi:cytosine/adenosine deaminase-related metal-dependent hydrolase
MSLLIKGGRVLTFNADKSVSFPIKDILIDCNRIAQIADNIDFSGETIDATGKIVSPGFIDAHRHCWQSHWRTATANLSLLGYLGGVLLGRAVFYRPGDVYLAQVGATAEAIYCGITTVLDHSHIQLSEQHIRKCIQASVESGIRSMYCFAPMTLPTSLNPLKMPDLTIEHNRQMALFYDLAKELPLGGSDNDGRVTLGLGYDGLQFRPLDDTQKLFDFAASKGMPITLHDCESHNMPALKFCRENKLTSNTMVFSHASYASDQDLEYAREHGAGIASTPESEMQMGHGWPEGFRALRMGVKTGLGVDSSAICSGDMFYTMRLLLQTQRARDNAELAQRGKIPLKLSAMVDQAIFMATLGGAEAVHRDHEIGSLEVGKLADLLIISMDSPMMVGSVDLAAAMVMHATPADVETVIVNGEIVKKNGVLQRVNWGVLKKELATNRTEMEEMYKHIDWDQNTVDVGEMWYLMANAE